ncbi:MAG TPA: gluconate 2-dehydrogenase subunit 3 family protein [Bryobacteraceae bacterium]|nr:gluconate 2-dehydrogenase subunit 3 family protein [Bryobacteraceae bacterium]
MPAKRTSVKRRRFLELGLTAGAAGSLISCGRTGGGAYWRFFTVAEARTLDAIAEQIIPTDDFPGASEAGVVRFIDLQLTRHYRKHRDAYRKGIAGVDAASRERFQKPFADLPPDQQEEVLREIQEKDAEFFALIRAHTMQGYYGDPRHGGNRDEVSWKMLGLPSPPVRGRVPYEKKAG